MSQPLLISRTIAAIEEACKPPGERKPIPPLAPAAPPDPVSTYLASLTNDGSRRTMAKALRRLFDIDDGTATNLFGRNDT